MNEDGELVSQAGAGLKWMNGVWASVHSVTSTQAVWDDDGLCVTAADPAVLSVLYTPVLVLPERHEDGVPFLMDNHLLGQDGPWARLLLDQVVFAHKHPVGELGAAGQSRGWRLMKNSENKVSSVAQNKCIIVTMGYFCMWCVIVVFVFVCLCSSAARTWCSVQQSWPSWQQSEIPHKCASIHRPSHTAARSGDDRGHSQRQVCGRRDVCHNLLI